MNRNHQYCPSSSAWGPLGPTTSQLLKLLQEHKFGTWHWCSAERGLCSHYPWDHALSGPWTVRCVLADHAQLEDLPLCAWAVALASPSMKLFSETYLVIQWLRICLSTQEICVRPLVRELRSHMPQWKDPAGSNEDPTATQTQCSQIKKKKNTNFQLQNKWVTGMRWIVCRM